VCLALLLTGCRTAMVATAADQQGILSSLVAYEESRGVHPVLAREIRPRIRVEGRRAWAEYRKSRPTEQIVGSPIVVELGKEGSDWVVTAEKCNWPWWWHVVNHTIGLK